MKWLLLSLVVLVASPIPMQLWPNPGPGRAPYSVTGPPLSSTVTAAFTARKIQGDVCVESCAVHFDAIGMGALSATPYVTLETTDTAFDREFHSLLFEWDFGDPGKGAWTTGAAAATATPQDKNYEIGGIAGHLYEDPGVYTVTLTVTNPNGDVDTTTQDVTVTDSATYFSDANTFCFANDDLDWTGCPLDCAGGDDNCTVLNTTATAPNLTTALNSGDNCSGSDDCANVDRDGLQRHVLFRRGDTFTSSSFTKLKIDGTTPGMIAAFGNPVSARPILNLAGGPLHIGKHWTLTELSFRQCYAAACLYADSETPGNFTYYNVDADDYTANCQSFNMGYPTNAIPALVAHINVDCVGTTLTSYSSWPAGNYGLWLGGTFNVNPNHIVGFSPGGPAAAMRVMHDQHWLFSHMTVVNVTPNRETFQFRCFVDPALAADVSACRYNLISDNSIEESRRNLYYNVRVCVDGSCAQGISASSCNDNTTCHINGVSNFIFERNFHHWVDDGTPSASKRAVYELQGGDITVRNNVYDYREALAVGDNINFVEALGQPLSTGTGTTPTGNIHVFNNTIYSSDTNTGAFGLTQELLSQGTGCGVTPVGCYSRNNLFVAPNFSGAFTHAARFVSTNNQKHTGANPFVATVPAVSTSTISDFALAATATTLIDLGDFFDPLVDTNRWVHDDAMRLCRPFGDNWDIGAHEYGAPSCN